MKSQFPDFALLGFNLTGDIGPLTAYTTEAGRVVMFPRAPPLNPPTDAQQLQRDRFQNVALWWSECPTSYKRLCYQMCRRASLRITAYAFCTFCALCPGRGYWETVCEQTGLYPEEPPDCR
jgi:hypothetical protein